MDLCLGHFPEPPLFCYREETPPSIYLDSIVYTHTAHLFLYGEDSMPHSFGYFQNYPSICSFLTMPFVDPSRELNRESSEGEVFVSPDRIKSEHCLVIF